MFRYNEKETDFDLHLLTIIVTDSLTQEDSRNLCLVFHNSEKKKKKKINNA